MGRYAFRPRSWTLERVVAEIRALHASGELGTTSALTAAGHGDLVGAAHRYAGGWQRAIVLAGIYYEPRRREWTEAAVLREIRRRHRAGMSLAATQVETSLVLAASRRFGSWRKARSAALPTQTGPYEQWTKEKLLDQLANLHDRGVSLSASVLRARGHGRLVNAAVRLYGSWQEACRRAVPDLAPTKRSWTRASLLRAIRARHREGRPMTATSVQRDDAGLMRAATRLYGGWPKARAAAGVAFHDPRNTWSRARVVAELRRRAPGPYRPTSTEVGQALYNVAIARFGSFDAACRAAGRSRRRQAKSVRRRGRK